MCLSFIEFNIVVCIYWFFIGLCIGNIKDKWFCCDNKIIYYNLSKVSNKRCAFCFVWYTINIWYYDTIILQISDIESCTSYFISILYIDVYRYIEDVIF